MEENEESRIRRIGVFVNEKMALVRLNIDVGLKENIKLLKNENNLPEDRNYNLKVRDSVKMKHRIGMYITEKTFETDIEDGNVLDLVLALDDLIKEILENPSDPSNCKSLFSLSGDPAFVSEIVALNKVPELVSLLKFGNMDSRGKRGCLLTILKLLQDGHLKIIEEDILETIIQIVSKNEAENQYALSVLSQILYIRDVELHRIKDIIIEKVTLHHTLPAIMVREGAGAELSLNALMMINAIINTVKDERRMSIISELKRPENRKRFYDLTKAQAVNDNLARELFILQTYLLSPYVKPLSRIVSWENLSINDSNRSSRDIEDDDDSMDLEVYENVEPDTISVSRDTLSRYSLASLSTLRSSSGDSHNPNDFISQLTNNCLAHYRNKYPKNFNLSLKEESNSEPGIARSSERIVQIMAQVLNIGNKIYKKGTRYIPMYFNPETTYFFEEIFIRMMYLLSQNKRKMKAKTLEDFDKVIMGLKKQLELILERKPDSMREFTKLMSDVTYEIVCSHWQKERRSEWMRALRSNPCIIQLCKELSAKNEYLLENQRLSVLKSGGIFPKLSVKKHKPQHFMLKLSANNRSLLMGDSNKKCSDFQGPCTEYRVDNIRHFVVGKACPHIKDESVPESHWNRVFSIMFGEEMSINCVAGDEKAANYWIDGFNILLERKIRSGQYYQELETLTDLDASVQLIELQNVKIPMKPPTIPPLPPTRTSPAVPPKMKSMYVTTSMLEDNVYCDI